jgi:exodeoxyribonuclease-3
MRIVSWNTNGLRGTLKAGMWEPFLKATKPDVICLQETKSEPEQLPKEFHENGWHSVYAWSKVKKGYSGTAILSKEKPLKVENGFGIKKFDDEGRTTIMYFKDFVLINCYFPNGGGGPVRLKYKLEFYDAFLKFIETLKKKHEVIFTGDVNTAHTAIDLARPKESEGHHGFTEEEREGVDNIIKAGFIDTFRYLHPDKKDSYTYWDQLTRARDRNVGWRIDYFFISKKLLPKLSKADILTDYYGSDHCPILIELA